LLELPDYKAGLTIDEILAGCGLCDAHGFLITAKKANSAGNTVARQRLSKHSLIEFSFALALPEQHSDSTQLFTRQGDSKEEGQMLMKVTARSGQYALNVRYASVGVGLDTDKWIMVVNSRDERLQRHRVILLALRDYILSPSGALAATLLPHLTSVLGAIVARKTVGRAPIYSGLQNDFIDQLMKISDESIQVMPFHSADSFCAAMNQLITSSEPYVMTRNGSTSTVGKRSASTPANRPTRNKR
jgi:CRISPR/Cas system-associated protein Cas7 (RAMP superfamily)